MNPRQQTIKQLSASGYELKRHGANHDIYYNPQTHSSDCVISLKKSHGVCYGIFNADFDENQTNFNMQKE